MRQFKIFVPLCAALAFASCGKKGEQYRAEPTPAEAAEPDKATEADKAAEAVPGAVEASGDHYKVLVENDAARLLLATWKPGEKDALHSHPDLSFYTLTAGKVAVHTPDGEKKEMELSAGISKMQGPVAGHQLENIGDAEMQLIILERKEGKANPAPEGAEPSADKASPENYEVLQDAEWVRVIRASWKPGVTDKPHSHPDSLAYVLTDGKGKISPAEGEAKEIEAKAGLAMPVQAAASHTFQNTGDAELSILIFELK